MNFVESPLRVSFLLCNAASFSLLYRSIVQYTIQDSLLGMSAVLRIENVTLGGTVTNLLVASASSFFSLLMH